MDATRLMFEAPVLAALGKDLRLEHQRVQQKYIAMTKALIESVDVDGFRQPQERRPAPDAEVWIRPCRCH